MGNFLEQGHEQRGFNIPFTFEGLNDLFWGSDIGRMFVLARLSGAFVARSSLALCRAVSPNLKWEREQGGVKCGRES